MRGPILVLVASLAGCTPALDWREVRPEGSAARATFPCRPASHARSVSLGGAAVEMSMFSCAAQGTVYALSFADVADPARVGVALDELAVAVQAHMRPMQSVASQPAAVRGMTPQPRATQWQLSGRLPDGRQAQERTVLFSYGTRVYQATMLGPSLEPQHVQAFFDGLAVGP